MMAGRPSSERRRFARVRVSSHALTLIAGSHVRLLDINLQGVMLACPPTVSAPPPGERAMLRVVLGTIPFTAEIEVRRGESVVTDGVITGRHLAATFVELTGANRQVVQRFLGKAAN